MLHPAFVPLALAVAAFCVAIPLILTGCGSSGSTNTTTPEPTPARTTSMPMFKTTSSIPTTTTAPATTTELINPMGCGSHCQNSSCSQHGWCSACEEGFKLTGPHAQCLYECATDLKVGPIINASNKGLCLDDTTFLDCPDSMLRVWPNTEEPIQSIRMFKAWGFGPEWTEAKREKAWDALEVFSKPAGNRAGIWECNFLGEWTPYDAMTQQKIAQAVAKGQTQIKWHHGTQDYIIDVKKQVQTNVVTNTPHPIRHVDSGAIRILVGTQITCNETEDDMDWENVKLLMKRLGASSIMGVAVGNELELLSQKDAKSAPKECIDRMWSGNYFWNKFQKRFSDLNNMEGFKLVPITSVFGGYALAGDPFLDTHEAGVLTFLNKMMADKDIFDRWVWTFNFYPYFDPSFTLDPGTANKCSASISRGTCWGKASCNVPGTAIAARQKMTKLTGNKDDTLWVGETGWSYPQSDTLQGNMAGCPDWSSRETFLGYYDGFMKWDMSLAGVKSPDHVFYFTMRDAINFDHKEHFGLTTTCQATKCKLAKQTSVDRVAAVTV